MARHKRRREREESVEKQERRVKRKRRFYIRLLIALVVLALVVTVVRNWENLSPDTLIPRITEWFSGGGGYPVDVSGSSIYRMDTADNCVVLLSDTYITMVDTSGKEVMRRTHAYSDPLLRTNGKYVLVAEKGGRRLQVETRSKTVMTQTTEYSIVTATVHKNGAVAVVTAAEQGYNARLSVYSAQGKLIYQRLCGSMIADVAFSPNGKQLAVATVGAEAGAMRSSVEVFSIKSADSEPLFTHTATDILLMRVAYLSDSVITAVGDNAVWMYQPKKDVCNAFAVTDGELTAFAIGDDSTAVLVKPYGAATGGTVTYIKADGKTSDPVSVQGGCRDMAVSGNQYAVLTDGYLYKISSKGIQETWGVPTDGKWVARIGDRLMVLGLQQLSLYED